MNKLVDYYLSNLIGKKCWGYSAGYPTAQEVFLQIGEKVLREKPLTAKKWKYGLEKYKGEYRIGVSSEWRLQTKKRPITGSCEPNHKDGPMLKGLEKVVNKKITDIRITDECGDLLIVFGNVYLKVFCNYTGNDDENYYIQDDMNWGLWEGDGLLMYVEKGCKIVCKSNKTKKKKATEAKKAKA